MEDKRFVIGSENWFNSEEAQNYLLYGEVYKIAVNTLIEHFDKNSDELHEHAKRFDDPESALLPGHAFGVLPLVYNFCHYMELKLKGLILMKGGKVSNTHNIDALLQKLQGITRSQRISKETECIINKMQKCDNHSADAFRYPYDAERKMHFKEDRDFLELVNDFEKFKKMVSIVMTDLINVEGDFDYERDNFHRY